MIRDWYWNKASGWHFAALIPFAVGVSYGVTALVAPNMLTSPAPATLGFLGAAVVFTLLTLYNISQI